MRCSKKSRTGAIFTGRQAVELKLIDQLGDEKTAIAWLVAQKNVKRDLPVRDFKLTPRLGDLTFLRTAASITLDALGLSAIARQVEHAGLVQAVDRLSLDGMLALWQPAGAQLIGHMSGVRAVLPHCGYRRNPESGRLSRLFAPPKFDLAS